MPLVAERASYMFLINSTPNRVVLSGKRGIFMVRLI